MREELPEMKEARKLLEYSEDFEEVTGNVHVHVEKKSDRAPAKIAISLVQAVKDWPQALVGLGLLALAAWWLWLHR